MSRFSEAVEIPVSPTLAHIKSFLEMRTHCDTDLDAMDKELPVDIMRIIPGTIWKIQAGISNTVPISHGEPNYHFQDGGHNSFPPVEHYYLLCY